MRRKLQIIAGIALGAFLVWFLFKDTNWNTVYLAIRHADWRWLFLAFTAVLASFITRILRWGYIVRSAKAVSFWSMFSATQIGFLGNFVLPGRVGEVIRALVLSRSEKIPFSQCFAFVALDRVTDLFGLIAMMLVSVLAFHPQARIMLPPNVGFPAWADGLLEPNAIRVAALSAAGFMLVVLAAMVLLYVNQRFVLKINDFCLGLLSKRLASRIHELLQLFAEGLHVFRSAWDITRSLFFSLVTWSLFCITYAAVLRAFRLEMPWYAPFIMLSLLAVVISLPGAPGFVGQFHAAIIAAMYIVSPTINPDVARAVAILSHLLNLAPVTAVGVYCLYVENLRLVDLRRESVGIEEDSPSQAR